MNSNEVQGVEVEFYIPHEIRLDDIATITLYRKVTSETFYESKEVLDNFRDNEDFFISWLSKILFSRGYPVARAVAKVNSTIIEALFSSDKFKYFIDSPYISRIKRICMVQNLKSSEPASNTSTTQDGENVYISLDQEKSTPVNILQDLSNDELYIFFSPINVIDSSKADALVLETDRGIIFLRLDSIPRVSSTTTTENNAKKKKRRSSKKKKKKRRARRRSKSSS